MKPGTSDQVVVALAPRVVRQMDDRRSRRSGSAGSRAGGYRGSADWFARYANRPQGDDRRSTETGQFAGRQVSGSLGAGARSLGETMKRAGARIAMAVLSTCLVVATASGVLATPASADVTIAGPVTGGNGSPAAVTTVFDLASVGYEQSEFFLSGTAHAYAPTAPLASDGRWDVAPSAEAPYTTRIIVNRPSDPSRFNGTVFVEWLNVSIGTDVGVDWGFGHNELIRRGFAWVGVSAQAVGVNAAKAADPARYGAALASRRQLLVRHVHAGRRRAAHERRHAARRAASPAAHRQWRVAVRGPHGHVHQRDPSARAAPTTGSSSTAEARVELRLSQSPLPDVVMPATAIIRTRQPGADPRPPVRDRRQRRCAPGRLADVPALGDGRHITCGCIQRRHRAQRRGGRARRSCDAAGDGRPARIRLCRPDQHRPEPLDRADGHAPPHAMGEARHRATDGAPHRGHHLRAADLRARRERQRAGWHPHTPGRRSGRGHRERRPERTGIAVPAWWARPFRSMPLSSPRCTGATTSSSPGGAAPRTSRSTPGSCSASTRASSTGPPRELPFRPDARKAQRHAFPSVGFLLTPSGGRRAHAGHHVANAVRGRRDPQARRGRATTSPRSTPSRRHPAVTPVVRPVTSKCRHPRRRPSEFIDAIVGIVADQQIEWLLPMFEEVFYLAAHRDRLEGKCEPLLPRLRDAGPGARQGLLRRAVPPARPLRRRVGDRDLTGGAAAAIGRFDHWFARAAYGRGGLNILTNTGPLAGEGQRRRCRADARRPVARAGVPRRRGPVQLERRARRRDRAALHLRARAHHRQPRRHRLRVDRLAGDARRRAADRQPSSAGPAR